MSKSSLNGSSKERLEKKSFKTFCVIGDPVDHSLSPLMHNAAFNFLNLNYSYIAFKVRESELEESIDSLRQINIAGFNVTIPHKVNIINFLDKMSEEAMLAGAVNTVKNENGRFMGYNTDIYGLMTPVEERISNFGGIDVLILGAGGSCRAAIVGLSKKKGIGKVNIANRNQRKLMKVVDLGKTLGLNCIGNDYSDSDKLRELSLKSKLIINTTSLGLEGEPSPLKANYIAKDSIVFDIVYRPVKTDLLKNAKEANATLIFGYEMLLTQGGKAFEIWTGLKPPYEVMKKSLLGLFGDPS